MKVRVSSCDLVDRPMMLTQGRLGSINPNRLPHLFRLPGINHNERCKIYMNLTVRGLKVVATAIALGTIFLSFAVYPPHAEMSRGIEISNEVGQQGAPAPTTLPVMASPPGAAVVEQRSQGNAPAASLAESFDGLGVGFEGPQGVPMLR